MPLFDGKINNQDRIKVIETIAGAKREYDVTIEQLRDALGIGEMLLPKPISLYSLFTCGDDSFSAGTFVYDSPNEIYSVAYASDQREAAATFKGVALDPCTAEFDIIRVLHDGVVTVACESSQYLPGQLVGVSTPSTVVAVDSIDLAIGKVYGDFSVNNVTELDIQLLSRYQGSKANAYDEIAQVTDNSGGSAGDTIALITDLNNSGSADADETRDAVASLALKVNQLILALGYTGRMQFSGEAD